MTICNETGLACGCQPDEGVPCLALNGGLKRLMLEWRAEAMRLQTVITAASGASPEPTAEQILKVARGFMEPLRYKLFCEGVAALASGAPTPEPIRGALVELVALKDLKEKIELGTHEPTDWPYYTNCFTDEAARRIAMSDYDNRKPRAWANARAALAPQVGAPGPGSVDPVASGGTRPAAAIDAAAFINDVADRLSALQEFHRFFEDRCEALFYAFGMEAIDKYNAAARLAASGSVGNEATK